MNEDPPKDHHIPEGVSGNRNSEEGGISVHGSTPRMVGPRPRGSEGISHHTEVDR
jgi:hypothetical protein